MTQMETILGIDLGTTNSEVAILRNGKAEVLCEEGEAILPSIVGLDAEGRLLVGRRRGTSGPRSRADGALDQRRMGSAETVRLGDKEYSPQEISSFILRKLKSSPSSSLAIP